MLRKKIKVSLIQTNYLEGHIFQNVFIDYLIFAFITLVIECNEISRLQGTTCLLVDRHWKSPNLTLESEI